MGIDVYIKHPDGKIVAELPTCRAGGIYFWEELLKDCGVSTVYDGAKFSINIVLKCLKDYVDTLTKATLLEYLSMEYPKFMSLNLTLESDRNEILTCLVALSQSREIFIYDSGLRAYAEAIKHENSGYFVWFE